MAPIKENKASNQCNNNVQSFNLGMKIGRSLCISIWATHSVSAVINYTRYIYRRSCCWRLQQQQMPPFIWTISGRAPASQKITRLACRKIQYVALFQTLCWKWVSEYTGITFHPLPSQMAPNLKWQTASREWEKCLDFGAMLWGVLYAHL